MADTLLKCTTRHVRLFTARVEKEDLVPSANELTLDLDPDNEFIWSEHCISQVQERFKQLVDAAAGGELSYNPDARVQNFSMGLPRTPELL